MILSPSLLAADFANLGGEVRRAENAGCEYLHLDVMDGVFVPNISFGLPVVSALRKHSAAVFDVHLMITSPIKYARRFVQSGADIVTFHTEACDGEAEIRATLGEIRSSGAKCGLAVCPATPVSAFAPFLGLIDMLLIMTVEPGFGGQPLIPQTLDKIADLREMRRSGGYSFDIQVDGGVTAANLCEFTSRGANVIVAGSALFGAGDMAEASSQFRKTEK